MVTDTPKLRALIREKMIANLDRNGYAVPFAAHVVMRGIQIAVLQQLASEGIVELRQYRVDAHGMANCRGRRTKPCWVRPGSSPARLTLLPADKEKA